MPLRLQYGPQLHPLHEYYVGGNIEQVVGELKVQVVVQGCLTELLNPEDLVDGEDQADYTHAHSHRRGLDLQTREVVIKMITVRVILSPRVLITKPSFFLSLSPR